MICSIVYAVLSKLCARGVRGVSVGVFLCIGLCAAPGPSRAPQLVGAPPPPLLTPQKHYSSS